MRCGPRDIRTTSVRYWAIVVSSAAAPSDLVATPMSVRLATSTASTAAGSAATSLIRSVASPSNLHTATIAIRIDCLVQAMLRPGTGVVASRRGSAVFGVLEVEAAAGVPFRALVAVGRDAAGVPEHPGNVQQVPRHERRVAVGEVVLRTAGTGVEI